MSEARMSERLPEKVSAKRRVQTCRDIDRNKSLAQLQCIRRLLFSLGASERRSARAPRIASCRLLTILDLASGDLSHRCSLRVAPGVSADMSRERTVKRTYEPVPECFRGEAPDDPYRQTKAVRRGSRFKN